MTEHTAFPTSIATWALSPGEGADTQFLAGEKSVPVNGTEVHRVPLQDSLSDLLESSVPLRGGPVLCLATPRRQQLRDSDSGFPDGISVMFEK